MVVFIHIPKVGGQSVAAVLEEIYGKQRVWRATRNKPLSTMTRKEVYDSFDAITGHYHYGDCQDIIDYTTCKFIAVVREPFTRLRSYYHHRHDRGYPDLSQYKTFRSYLESKDSESQDNKQADILTTSLDKYWLLGTTDKLDLFITTLVKKLGINRPIETPHVNKTTPTTVREDIPQDLKDRILARNWLDVQLYERVKLLEHENDSR